MSRYIPVSEYLQSTRFASLSTWAADDQGGWQLLVKSSLIFGSIHTCQQFNRALARLEYRLDDQIFNPSLTFFGDPETETQFKQRLPIFRLTFTHQPNRERFQELDSSQVSLLKHLHPTSELSLSDYVTRFTQDTPFSLLAVAVLDESDLVVA